MEKEQSEEGKKRRMEEKNTKEIENGTQNREGIERRKKKKWMKGIKLHKGIKGMMNQGRKRRGRDKDGGK